MHEVIMMCLDNSDYTRNGDFSPTRLISQNECVTYIARQKLDTSVESNVGFLSMAGKRVTVHITPCRSLGRILNSVEDEVRPHGEANIVASLKTAQLALKNRQNKNLRQRIIVFIGSPLKVDVKALTKAAKQLKKNNVAVDVVSFAPENMDNENEQILTDFVNAVNSGDNSHLVKVLPNTGHLVNLIQNSPVMAPDSAAPGGTVSVPTAVPANNDFPGGVDPNMDPELAMAIAMSLQEEQNRQGGPGPVVDGAPAAVAANEPQAAMDIDDEDAMLAQAIAMSMAAEQPNAAAANDDGMEVENVEEALHDAAFVQSLLESVDMQGDVDVDDIMGDLDGDDKDKKKEDKKKEDKK